MGDEGTLLNDITEIELEPLLFGEGLHESGEVTGEEQARMKRHGGQAEIRSEPGDGTEVRLTMPINPEARRRRAQATQTTPATPATSASQAAPATAPATE